MSGTSDYYSIEPCIFIFQSSNTMSNQLEFIPHIDDANAEVQRLEAKLGLPASDFIPHVEDANDRIAILAKQLGEYQHKAPSNTKPGASNINTAPSLKATGLHRAIAANSGRKTDLSSQAAPLTGLQRAIAANAAKAK